MATKTKKNSAISKRKVELEQEFAELEAEKTQLEQRGQEIVTRMIQLQGAYQLVGSLEEDSND